MIVEFIYSQKITNAEFYEDLRVENDKPSEGKLVSDKELIEYSDVARDILTKAEAHFPEFSGDTGTTVNLYFMDNEMIHSINKAERGVDRATDVLSFPFLGLHEGDGTFSEYDLNPDNAAIMLGEILVSIEKMREQAKEYGHSEKRELAFLVCHAFLHLMGYDHIEKKDEEIMFPLTEKILKEAGYTR